MQQTEFSIEFCHIYLNEIFSSEHQQSIIKLKELIEKFEDNNVYSLNVLIDDYNATEEVLDVKDLKQKLEEAGVKPDYLAYEARLAEYSQDLLDQMNEGKIKKKYTRYIEEKGIVPCSFMIAIWYLLRLGAIPQKPEALVYDKNGGHSKTFSADKLISILPYRFRGVEKKAETIISATPFSKLNSRIQHIYFDSTTEKRVLTNVN